MPLPFSGVAVRWMSLPSRSTPRVSGVPTECLMASAMELGLVKRLPSTETMVSPTRRPARAAGVVRPGQCSSEATL